MQIELINTGTELMLGQVLNTHLGYLSNQLANIGQRITRQCTIPDGDIIRQMTAESFARADIILVTGGLGPTSDDITRDILAEMFDAPLEFHPDIYKKIEAYFASRNIVPPEITRVQAMVPKGARVLENNCGTAPGLHFEKDGKHVFCLPGPPRELQPMFEEQVLPVISKLVSGGTPILQHTYRIIGYGESYVQEMIEASLRKYEGIEIGYCARPGEVDLRLVTSRAQDLSDAGQLVWKTFGSSIYAENGELMEDTVVRLATEKGILIATAESCTGGLVANRITNVSGASQVLDRGWVTYSNESKMEELGVSAESLSKYGAVSPEVAGEMARGAIQKSRASLSVSLTGIAGPTGGTPTKPVGLVYFGLARKVGGEIKVSTLERKLIQRRDAFKGMASQIALDLLRHEIQEPALG